MRRFTSSSKSGSHPVPLQIGQRLRPSATLPVLSHIAQPIATATGSVTASILAIIPASTHRHNLKPGLDDAPQHPGERHVLTLREGADLGPLLRVDLERHPF